MLICAFIFQLAFQSSATKISSTIWSRNSDGSSPHRKPSSRERPKDGALTPRLNVEGEKKAKDKFWLPFCNFYDQIWSPGRGQVVSTTVRGQCCSLLSPLYWEVNDYSPWQAIQSFQSRLAGSYRGSSHHHFKAIPPPPPHPGPCLACFMLQNLGCSNVSEME